MWMNEWDIDDAVELIARHRPEYLPYAKYLADFRDIVNENSDGWAHWKPAGRAARVLMSALFQVTSNIRHGSEPMPSDWLLKRSLSPIKYLAKRKGLPVPTLSK